MLEVVNLMHFLVSKLQVVAKMGILVIKIATTFITKCMNVTAIKATSSVTTDTAVSVSTTFYMTFSPYANFATFI